jgi:hypothetical protein
LIGFIIPLIERTSRILEPITFPIAISLFFLIAATIDVTNSGKDVPAATMVQAIIFSLSPNILAIDTLSITTSCPPTINPVSPS